MSERAHYSPPLTPPTPHPLPPTHTPPQRVSILSSPLYTVIQGAASSTAFVWLTLTLLRPSGCTGNDDWLTNTTHTVTESHIEGTKPNTTKVVEVYEYVYTHVLTSDSGEW